MDQQNSGSALLLASSSCIDVAMRARSLPAHCPARRMRRKIQNPRILLLDCPLEYKKGESQTNVELSKEEDW